MVSQYEVNKRILHEIEKYTDDEYMKNFLLEVLRFELQHLEEREYKSSIYFREDYNRIIDKYMKFVVK